MTLLAKFPVVPVLVIEDASWAADLGHCLVESGLEIVEVTLRTKQSWLALSEMRKISGLTIGMGSVARVEDLARGKEIGVDFAVSAGLSEGLVSRAKMEGIPYVPGVATPSELLQAVQLGLEIVKWFPAETLGGIPALRAISAPFPGLRFVPTGGINAANARNYLGEKNVVSVGGSWMFAKEVMAQKDLTTLSQNLREAAAIVKEAP